MLLHYLLGMWKKETNILSPISDSFHLMWHFISTMFNQGVNVWFNLYHWGSLFFIPLILMWLNPTPSFVFLFIIHVSWPKNPHDFVPRSFAHLQSLSLCKYPTCGQISPQMTCSKLVFKNFLSFGEGYVDNNLRNNTLLPLLHKKIFCLTPSLSSRRKLWTLSMI
jgi:hypothetical protein